MGDESVTKDPAAAENAEAAPTRKRWLLLVPALVLGLGLGGFLAYAQYDVLDQALGGLFGAQPPAEGAPIEYGEFKELPGLIVNPAESGGSRYLMVSVGFESASAAPLAEIEEKSVVVRDTIIAVLSVYSVEQLTDYGHRNRLKDELRSAVNGILRKGTIDRLYFTQYVLQ